MAECYFVIVNEAVLLIDLMFEGAPILMVMNAVWA